MSPTLYASFEDASMAEKAAGALLDHGVRQEDISLVAHESHLSRSAYSGGATDIGADYTHAAISDEYNTAVIDQDPATRDESFVTRDRTNEDTTDLTARTGISTTTPADAASGAAKGAGIGLGVGVLAALASLAVPGFGLVLGGGALATAIAGAIGATAAGAAAGGITGYLKDQGVPEAAATRYGETFNRGGAVLAVNVPSNNVDTLTAQSILAKYGALNVATYGSTPL